jgi:Rrf2 family protein
MFHLSRRVDYGMILLTHLGLHAGEALSARALARTYRLSPSLTASVLKSLQRRRLVASRRGIRGGYALRRAPEAIHLSDVIDAVDGCWSLVDCQRRARNRSSLCDLFARCPIRAGMDAFASRLRELFSQTTLQHFIDQAVSQERSRPAKASRSCTGGGAGGSTFHEIPVLEPARGET